MAIPSPTSEEFRTSLGIKSRLTTTSLPHGYLLVETPYHGDDDLPRFPASRRSVLYLSLCSRQKNTVDQLLVAALPMPNVNAGERQIDRCGINKFDMKH